ncbi:MAG: hypothetical protein FJ035_04520 [Chloroflexi bacterium]|nr:hypothetical protein [Chloroflexota bacterium]
MTSGTSVVTPERYKTGLGSFAEWMDAIGQRKYEFQRHYDEYTPDPADIAKLKALVERHGVHAFVIGEDWCPDVWRGLPVAAKVAKQSGMEMRYFMRDQNKDIMAEFLNQGEFESIPTVVFYDRDHRYLGHFIERPMLANEEMVPLRKILEEAPKEDGPERQAVMDRYRAATWDAAPAWRHATLKEFVALLERALA